SVNTDTPVGTSADRAPTALQQVSYQPPQAQPMPPAVDRPIQGPRGQIDARALEELGIIIISGNTPQDVEEVIKIIEIIRERYKDAQVAVELVPLEQGDATAVTNFLSQLFQRVN